MGRARNLHAAAAAPARVHDSFDGVLGTRRGSGATNPEYALLARLKNSPDEAALSEALAHLESLHEQGCDFSDPDERSLARTFASAVLVNVRPQAELGLSRLMHDLYYAGARGAQPDLDRCWEHADSWFCDQVEMNPDAYFDGSGMDWVRDGALSSDGLLAGVAFELAPLYAKAPMRTLKGTIGGAAPYRELERRTEASLDGESVATRVKALTEQQWWMTFSQLNDCAARLRQPMVLDPDSGANTRSVLAAFTASVEQAVRGEY